MEAPTKSPVGDQKPESVVTKTASKEPTRKDLDDTHLEILKGFIENNNTGLSDKEYEKQILRDWRAIGEI